MPVHSTLSTFDPMPTLTLILTPQSGPARLDAVLGNPFLHSIFQGALNSHILDYRISLTDIMAHLNNNAHTTYTLDSDIAGSLFSVFKKLIQVITCAGNNFNPNINIIPLPSDLPKDAVASLSMPELVTSWGALSTSVNPLALEFYSITNIFKMFRKLQDIANFLFGWIAEAVKVSVSQGQNSKWNFGSYFGLTFKDFFDRIQCITQGHPYWSALSGLVQCYNATTAKKGALAILSGFLFFYIKFTYSSKTSSLFSIVPLTFPMHNSFAILVLISFMELKLTLLSRKTILSTNSKAFPFLTKSSKYSHPTFTCIIKFHVFLYIQTGGAMLWY